MNVTTCPFCGLVTDAPHETQQGCIDALHAEIARVRGILEVSRPADVPRPAKDADEETWDARADWRDSDGNA